MSARAASASDLAARLFERRADWLPRYFPAGRIEGGVFYLGDADGSPGRSMPIPLCRQPHLVDFAGDFRGDDLDLLTRAIGGDGKAGYAEALAFLGIAGKMTAPRRPLPPDPEPDLDNDNNEHAQELWREALPLCDCIARGPDGWHVTSFSAGAWFSVHERQVTNFGDLATLLERVAEVAGDAATRERRAP